MVTWPKDTQAARNAFYGDPGKGQIASQMVPVVPPFAMYYTATKSGTTVNTIKRKSMHRERLSISERIIIEWCAGPRLNGLTMLMPLLST